MAVCSKHWAVNNEQWTVNNGQWTMGNGQWAVGSVQCTVYSVLWAITVGSGQWTFNFTLAIFGSRYKIFTTYRFKYSLEAKIRFQSKFVSHIKFADSLRCEISE